LQLRTSCDNFAYIKCTELISKECRLNLNAKRIAKEPPLLFAVAVSEDISNGIIRRFLTRLTSFVDVKRRNVVS